MQLSQRKLGRLTELLLQTFKNGGIGVDWVRAGTYSGGESAVDAGYCWKKGDCGSPGDPERKREYCVQELLSLIID
jgi:hypothetical protein